MEPKSSSAHVQRSRLRACCAGARKKKIRLNSLVAGGEYPRSESVFRFFRIEMYLRFTSTIVVRGEEAIKMDRNGETCKPNGA